MKRRIILIGCVLLCTVLIGRPLIALAEDNLDDPIEEFVEIEMPVPNGIYSPEDFDALSDEDKRDIYFNSPQRLPAGFDAAQYWDVIHAEE